MVNADDAKTQRPIRPGDIVIAGGASVMAMVLEELPESNDGVIYFCVRWFDGITNYRSGRSLQKIA